MSALADRKCSSNQGLPHVVLPPPPPAFAWSQEIFLIFSLCCLPPSKLKLDDEVTTVQVKELDHDVLVLRKVSSHNPAPTSGSAESDWR